MFVGVSKQLWICDPFFVKLFTVDLCAELNHVPQVYSLFSVSYEESFCHKCSRTIEDLRFNQSME